MFAELRDLVRCFECGATASFQHHVVPRLLGGRRTLPLCGRCHSLAHHLNGDTWMDHGRLTKEGLRRAKERGVKLGKPFWYTHLIPLARVLRDDGLSPKEIRDVFRDRGLTNSRGGPISLSAVRRILEMGESLQLDWTGE